MINKCNLRQFTCYGFGLANTCSIGGGETKCRHSNNFGLVPDAKYDWAVAGYELCNTIRLVPQYFMLIVVIEYMVNLVH